MRMKGDYRLVTLGAGGVGKSSLLARFLDGTFETKYRPTVDEFDRRTIQLPDGGFHSVEFLDTAGLHQFPAMRHLSILTGSAFVIVYAIDNYSSFRDALSLSELIKEIKGDNCMYFPMILVGNKSDLSDRRTVSKEEAENGAVSRGCAFIETSAKYNDNVQQLFMDLIVKIFQNEPEQNANNPKPKKHKSYIRSSVKKMRMVDDAVNNNNNNNTDDGKCSVM